MEIKTNEKKFSTRTLTVTAMFLAMNIIMSSSMLSVPVPGGHIYLNNAIITIASILLNPLCAFRPSLFRFAPANFSAEAN